MYKQKDIYRLLIVYKSRTKYKAASYAFIKNKLESESPSSRDNDIDFLHDLQTHMYDVFLKLPIPVVWYHKLYSPRSSYEHKKRFWRGW